MSEIRELARGKWRSILPHYGVSPNFLKVRHGPCIICGTGKDRARFDDKGGYGTFYCSQCDPHCYDGFKLIEHLTGKSFAEVAREVEQIVGHVPADPPKSEPDDRQCAIWMQEAWKGTEAIDFGDPVDQWLNHRVGGYTLDAVGRSSLRYHPAVPYWGEGKKLGEFPAMLARVVGPDGKNRQLHRTFLTPDGQKAPVPQARMVMKGNHPPGSYVPLMDHTDQVLGIAEGIESAFAAALKFKVPVWAALNSVQLKEWTPPVNVQHVIVFGDNDPHMTGQLHAYALAQRLFKMRESGKLKCKVEVLIPPTVGHDWNNVWNPNL